MNQMNNLMIAPMVVVMMLNFGPVFAKSVSIGTLPQGSLAYGIASSVAKVISDNSDLVTRAVGIGGSNIYIPQVDQGKLGCLQPMLSRLTLRSGGREHFLASLIRTYLF